MVCKVKPVYYRALGRPFNHCTRVLAMWYYHVSEFYSKHTCGLIYAVLQMMAVPQMTPVFLNCKNKSIHW